jgi:queuosine precursor transporter
MNTKTTTALVIYASTVPIANWMIDNVGTEAFPGGPHVIPVGFGFDAPSGVLAIGVALAARDAVQRLAGKRVALAAIAVGVALSFLVASPALATASAVAFMLGELADFFVYTPLAERSRRMERKTVRRYSGAHAWDAHYVKPAASWWLPLAILASGAVGAVVDSLVFLQIAFGSTMFWQGQVIGKAWVALAAALGVLSWRSFTSRGASRPGWTFSSSSAVQELG